MSLQGLMAKVCQACFACTFLELFLVLFDQLFMDNVFYFCFSVYGTTKVLQHSDTLWVWILAEAFRSEDTAWDIEV